MLQFSNGLPKQTVLSVAWKRIAGKDASEVRELKSLADDLAPLEGQNWSEAHEFELTERALALYVDMAEGALIF
jgi:hypothetical protein